MKLHAVKDDLFHIARRLKEIDVRYELYFNRAKWRFEIHANGAMQLALPFDRIDGRTLDFARRTRLENAKNLIDDIEKQNNRLQLINERKAYEKRIIEMEATL